MAFDGTTVIDDTGPLKSTNFVDNFIVETPTINPNASLTIADHISVSKEAQAIIGGVVGFWGGVFCMGSIYLLVVFLRRCRKHVSLSGKSVQGLEQKLTSGYSGMFGQARNNPNIDLMDQPRSGTGSISMSRPAQQSLPLQSQQSTVGTNPSGGRPQRTRAFAKPSSSFGLSSSSGGFGSSSGGTKLKFSGFGLGGSSRDDGGMADCQL